MLAGRLNGGLWAIASRKRPENVLFRCPAGGNHGKKGTETTRFRDTNRWKRLLEQVLATQFFGVMRAVHGRVRGNGAVGAAVGCY